MKNKFNLETTTVWSFPERGEWVTHNPKYKGNFAPQVARNIILRYSNEGDTVLDPMVGGGTTLIETKLLHRKGIGIDINPEAVEITSNNINFKTNNPALEQIVKVGDIRNLDFIDNNSIDLILTHPPYLNIIKYSNSIDGDISHISDMKLFCDELEKGAKELFKVLKENHYCAILIGDTRKGKHYVPLAYNVMERFLQVGFILKEDIIKTQHNCSSMSYWKNQNCDFMLIMHEHLFVFRKPKANENLDKIKYSTGKKN